MIGQKALLKHLDSYNIDNFPRSLLLIGDEGSGKHLISQYIKDNILKLPILDITQTISDEYLDEIYRNPNPAIYLIDLSDTPEKSQNILLKFVEEPPNNAFIIILAEHRNLVLNTILNRCLILELEKYSRDELREFASEDVDDIVLQILKTPGRLKATNLKTFADAQALAHKIITKIDIASYPNTLSLADKVNYKDEYDKIDLDIFLDLLCFSMFSYYLKHNNRKILTMYQITREARKSLLDKRLNKRLLFEHYLSEIWYTSRGN